VLVKIIVVIAVIAAVVYGVKYLTRVKAKRDAGAYRAATDQSPTTRRFAWARRMFKAEDLVECPRCGTFVRSLGEHHCPRAA
jgi:hypothetical protein